MSIVQPVQLQRSIILSGSHPLLRKPPEFGSMSPALAQSPVTQRHKRAHADEMRIPVRLIGFFLHEGAHSGIGVMYEIDQIFLHAMEAGGKTLKFDAFEVD